MSISKNLLALAALAALFNLGSAAPAHAADQAVWDCEGDVLEGLSIQPEKDGVYPGGVSWDCFHGGGICDRDAKTVMTHHGQETVFAAHDFKLTIRTGLKPAEDGSYSAHIWAIASGPSDEGGGFELDTEVSCSKPANH